eukprot:1428158-Prymnesium_polylepis.1
MVQQAKAEKLSVEAARDYLNSTLLQPPHVTAELLADYNISLPIALSTAWFWMKQSGAVSGTFKQSFYNDHHENAMVVKDREVRRATRFCALEIAYETARYRNRSRASLPSGTDPLPSPAQERYIPAMNKDELRQPLWVQLTRAEYDALKSSHAPNLPEGHGYTVRSGGGGRTQTHMVELHVDAADAFDELRAASPYGGSFSVRFPGGAIPLPSAPPAALPNPAEDTLSLADAEAAAEAAAETARTLQAAGVTQAPPAAPTLTEAKIKQMKVPELRATCEARGLETAGLKAQLIERLIADVNGVEEDEGSEDETGEYNVLKIHDHRVVDQQLQYLVEWKGWDGETTWEPVSAATAACC